VTVTEQAGGETRAKRSDAGQVRLGPRDVEAITWLETMRVISEPDLAVLLTRIAGRGELLSEAAARAVATRWARAGYARRGRLLVAAAPFVWLTAAGAGLVSADGYREPKWAAMPHASAIARARLWLETHPDPAMRAEPGSWVSEREWRAESRIGASVPAYVPDGEMTNATGHRIAVEVEIAPKGTARTVTKVKRAASALDWVLFLVQDDTQAARAVRTAILTAARQAGDDIARRVRAEVLPGRLDR
jgi:hypothetical protein